MEEIWYRGIGNGAGPRPVIIENAEGDMVGVLEHVVKHSPTGFSWGYAGSGPADLARSILIAVLGDKAECPECAGTGRIVVPKDFMTSEAEYEPAPFDPEKAAGYEDARLEVVTCWEPGCEKGYNHDAIPYQEFKRQFVAGWGPEWRISQAEIEQWLAARQRSYNSYEEFAAANPARHADGGSQADYGYDWTEDGQEWPRHRVSYIRETGEVYETLLIAGASRVNVLGVVPADPAPPGQPRAWRATLDAVLDGWAEPDQTRGWKLSWVTERLAAWKAGPR